MSLSTAEQVHADWLAAMYAGDFERAWQATDRIELPRRQASRLNSAAPDQLTWDGTPFSGRHVLVRCEHGLGDSIQFCRYIHSLAQQAWHVVLKTQPMLLDLFRGLPAEVINAWTPAPDPPHDVVIEVMELAYAFRSTLDSLPSRTPYLPLPAEQFVLPAGPVNGFNVGVLWSASAWDLSRSLPLAELSPLASVPNVRLFSLQQGPAECDASGAPFDVISLSSRTTSICAAAAAMLALDAIVSIDGMPAHLAGALARPTFILLKHHADWRWMNNTAPACWHRRSPWYPTARLFRQPSPGDWATPVHELRVELAALLSVNGHWVMGSVMPRSDSIMTSPDSAGVMM